jgi:hypothetical protein
MADALWDLPGARAHSDLSCTTGLTCGAPSRHHLGLERFVLHAMAPLREPSSRTRSGRSPLAQGVSTPPDDAYRNDLGASDPYHHRTEGFWREQPGLLAGNSPTLGAAAPRSRSRGPDAATRPGFPGGARLPRVPPFRRRTQASIDHHRSRPEMAPTRGRCLDRAPGSSSSDRGHSRAGPLVLVDRRHARTGRPRLGYRRR